MSEKGIMNILFRLGLPRREAEIYIYLSKRGLQTGRSVSTSLKIERVQTYRALKSLQGKGVVEATLEHPTRFTAIPLDVLVESLIKTKKSEVTELENEKDDLVTYWKSLGARDTETTIARFRILAERRRIYAEIQRMIEETKEEIFVLTTSLGVIQEDVAGIFDTITDSARKSPSQFRILTNITKENQEIIEQTISNKNLNIQWRHIDLGSRLPRFVTKDGEEAVLYVASRDELPLIGQADTGLWISDRMFVSTLRESFMEMWLNATGAEERIEELKTGRPSSETAVIRDMGEAQTKIEEVLGTAKENIMVITSSDGIYTILENSLFQTLLNRSLRLRVMAPIDTDNFAAAQRLSETCEIRHVPITYLMMLLVDNRHLFIFKTPSPDEATVGTTLHLDNIFYTNDARYVERVSEMLVDIWKRGVDIKETSSGTTETQSIQVLSTESASMVINEMLENNSNSVIVTENSNPIGVISEKDLLEKVLKPRRDPDRTYAKEIMSLPVMTIESEEPLMQALRAMRKTGIGRLAVIKNGKLAGMLNLRPHTD